MFQKINADGDGNSVAGRDIININNHYEALLDADKINDDAINEIFKHLMEESQAAVGFEEDKNSQEAAHLREKISLNFSPETQLELSASIRELWKVKSLVEDFIKMKIETSEVMIIGIKNKIQMMYREIKNTPSCQSSIEDIRIIDQMVVKCVPQSKAGDSTCAVYARAIIYYFFELCDFGKKTQLEESKIKTL